MIRRLFPIQLQGIGSGEVESFPSYLFRCSYEHGLSVGEFIKFLIRNSNGNEKLLASTKFADVSELLKPSRKTQTLIDLFKKSSSIEVKRGTLWFLNNNLGDARSLISKGFKWCPECFYEMSKMELTPYYKLVWHFKDITHCNIHRTPLIDECPECHNVQKTLKVCLPLNECQKCGSSLSTRIKRLKPSEMASSWDLSGADLSELLSDMATVNYNSFAEDGVSESLEHLFDYYWNQDREKEFYSLLSRDELLAIIHKQTKIGLKRARRIAYRMGTSIYTLISGNAHQSSAVLNSNWLCPLPAAYEGHSKKNMRDHRKVIRKAKHLIASSEPPSLKEAAKKLGVSVGYLEYRFPVLTHQIVLKHKEFEEEKILKERYLAQSKALSFFLEEKYSSQIKSKRQAYRTLRRETNLPRELLKNSIRTAYEALT